jgi:glycosyltransferase involved in cell wall biosynthesis
MKPKVAVVIPAHDEAARIEAVLRAVLRARLVDEIIVVDDGSTDGTSEVVKRFEGVRLVKFSANLGKAGAMQAGVGATEAEIIAFLDADLVGLTPDHVDLIVRPLLLDQCDMCIGVFRGGKFWSDTAQRITPLISGQRAIRREIIYAFPFFQECRMGAEVLLNMAAKRSKARVMRVILRGVSNSFKERKFGLVKGTAARYQMYKEITQAMVRYRSKRKPPKAPKPPRRPTKRKPPRDRFWD